MTPVAIGDFFASRGFRVFSMLVNEPRDLTATYPKLNPRPVSIAKTLSLSSNEYERVDLSSYRATISGYGVKPSELLMRISAFALEGLHH